ncbi:hypothetical protein BDZ90DRAFT_72494 [Jaminaea rosea]|uniref:Uncharacterized protein n=1 Tax=Jaminaea rosea TaxID=1569628 RepID=A0A316UQ92_9BASI|nr:hypothetical protein BDZ90DRAFT_72494 [Jaminaea rosea]PWN25305.1 hypothetical protein BDZ90DRAFT_72494 [Jaminaea rosea]
MAARTALNASQSANKDNNNNNLSQQLAKLQAKFGDCDAQRIANARKLGDVETELRLSHQREAKLKASLDKVRDSAPQQSNRELASKLQELTRLHQEAKEKHRSAMAKMERENDEELKGMRKQLERAQRQLEEQEQAKEEAEERAELVAAQLRATTRAAQEIGERLAHVDEEKRDLAFELQLQRVRQVRSSSQKEDDSRALLLERIEELEQQAARDAQLLEASESAMLRLLKDQDAGEESATISLDVEATPSNLECINADLQAALDLNSARLTQTQQDLSALHASYLSLLSSSKQHESLIARITTLEHSGKCTQEEHAAALANLAETQQRLQSSRNDGSALRSQLAELRTTQRQQLEATKASQQEVALTRTRLAHLEETNADLLAALQHAVPYEERYHSVLSQAKMTVARLQACEEQLASLAEENLALASHENPAQKILYLDGVRRELLEAKARVGELECEVQEEKRRRQGVEGELSALKGLGSSGGAGQSLSASIGGGGRVRRVAAA